MCDKRAPRRGACTRARATNVCGRRDAYVRILIRACIYACCKKLVPAFIRDCERAIKQIRMEFHDEKGSARARARVLGNCAERAIDEKASFQRELITKLIFIIMGFSQVPYAPFRAAILLWRVPAIHNIAEVLRELIFFPPRGSVKCEIYENWVFGYRIHEDSIFFINNTWSKPCARAFFT